MALPGAACSQTTVQSRFENWTTAIIAADWRDGRGEPIRAFDNARRDLESGFQSAGLPAASMIAVSLDPRADDPATGQQALTRFAEQARHASAGCLLYLTSHGSPEAIVFGPQAELTPGGLATVLRQACPSRPTVLIVSACFSGIFVDGLAAPNRMIFTAARRDRTSFGCGVDNDYTYFDGCVIRSLETADDFIALANQTRACVRRREKDTGATPPSEPQVHIGADMQLLLPTLRFNPPSP